jgi:hypothetical protein
MGDSHAVAGLRADFAGHALTKGVIQRPSVVRLRSGDARMSAGNGDERTRSPSAILPTKEMSAATVGGTKLLRPWTDARPYTLLNDARVAVMSASGCDRYSESRRRYFFPPRAVN